MKRNPHPDLVREALKRWRTRLMRALGEVAKLEKALARAEKRKAEEAREAKRERDRARRRHIVPPAAEELR